MKKGRIKTAAMSVVMAGILCGCSAADSGKALGSYTYDEKMNFSGETDASEQKGDGESGGEAESEKVSRPFLVDLVSEKNTGSTIRKVKPQVEGYGIEADLSNIENLEQFYFQDEAKAKLAQNGFVVSGSAGSEFFEIYEYNRYWQIPNFITVDSLMHTYGLYFHYLMKSIEKDYLADKLLQLSRRMLDGSISQYELLRGSEWEEAAKQNVAFFTVGAKLLDGSTAAEEEVAAIADEEIGHILEAEEIALSGITNRYEDYTQYKPQGYYVGDAELENYFRAMIWYGRTYSAQETEEPDRSALLITKALMDDPEGYELWELIYAATTFFSGSDDGSGVQEYEALIQQVCGGEFTVDELASIDMEGKNTASGFRFIGQGFTVDSTIMQELVYSTIGENSKGEKRIFPDVLDVPAVLGSDTALGILQEQGAAEYVGYTEAVERLRMELGQDTEPLKNTELYSNWLYILRPLLLPKEEGYPPFMQNEEWMKRSLECFAGSLTELKHNNISYSKQVTAETGENESAEKDEREEKDVMGYVEPEPLVYFRFADLARRTAEGLKKYGMLAAEEEDNLYHLAVIADRLYWISNRELTEEVLSPEEYDFIQYYGAHIRYIWTQVISRESNSLWADSEEYPAAIVTDIAANLDSDNPAVLEAATGTPSAIYVAVKADGRLQIAVGSVYSFYQFAWPGENGLTDSEWRYIMGLEANEDGNYSNETQPVQRSAWTESYRDLRE